MLIITFTYVIHCNMFEQYFQVTIVKNCAKKESRTRLTATPKKANSIYNPTNPWIHVYYISNTFVNNHIYSHHTLHLNIFSNSQFTKLRTCSEQSQTLDRLQPPLSHFSKKRRFPNTINNKRTNNRISRSSILPNKERCARFRQSSTKTQGKREGVDNDSNERKERERISEWRGGEVGEIGRMNPAINKRGARGNRDHAKERRLQRAVRHYARLLTKGK